VIREERRRSATWGQIDVLPGCGLQEAVEGDRNRADAVDRWRDGPRIGCDTVKGALDLAALCIRN
jgi:hypothetical protein